MLSNFTELHDKMKHLFDDVQIISEQRLAKQSNFHEVFVVNALLRKRLTEEISAPEIASDGLKT